MRLDAVRGIGLSCGNTVGVGGAVLSRPVAFFPRNRSEDQLNTQRHVAVSWWSLQGLNGVNDLDAFLKCFLAGISQGVFLISGNKMVAVLLNGGRYVVKVGGSNLPFRFQLTKFKQLGLRPICPQKPEAPPPPRSMRT